MTAIDILTLPAAYHLWIEDYRLLDDSGAFRDFAKTALIEGVIVPAPSQYFPHSRVQRLRCSWRQYSASSITISNLIVPTTTI